jgi:hypothetical protein
LLVGLLTVSKQNLKSQKPLLLYRHFGKEYYLHFQGFTIDVKKRNTNFRIGPADTVDRQIYFGVGPERDNEIIILYHVPILWAD